MAKCCGNCANLELDNKEKYTSKDRYWCKEGHGYKELTDTCPSNYDYIYKPVSDNNDGYTRAGCYITTIVCQLLGYDDNCELLNVLRNFRETFLKRNRSYYDLLLEYDTYGPEICNKLRMEDKDHRMSLTILYNYLIPCVELIKDNDFDKAISKYQMMVNFLINWYNIERKEIKINLMDINIQTLGKGRIRLNKVLA